MELTIEQMNENFERLINILGTAVQHRQGSDWEGLERKLRNSDFSIAPASSKYHGAFKGGLCCHCLSVYDKLKKLVEMEGLTEKISEDSIAIVALLHDFSKMNLYQESVKNVKVYSECGSKHDELGRFDWVAQKAYAVRQDSDNMFLLGNHEENAEYMVGYFVPLTIEESAAILNHHMGMSYDSTQGGIAMKAACRYPLVSLLHVADFLSTTVEDI